MENNVDKTCIAHECERPAYSRLMCLMHYKRWQKYGDPNARKVRPLTDDLDAVLNWTGWTITDYGCWEWNGRKGERGYGQVSFQNKEVIVSRMAYTAWVGEIPEDYMICHTCDNPPCINPKHLFAGTSSDNMNDMFSKGRGNRPLGERNKNSKLTGEQARQIKLALERGEIGHSLAIRYGVSDSTISHIKKGMAWKWIN